MEKIIVIVGPTAVGKTSLSIQLAKHFQGEIISGDSMQIYRGLDIGTAKVTVKEMQGIAHHLIDIREKEESYSVAEFQKEARQHIKNIQSRGNIPIIAGGTGLYIQALLYDYKLGATSEEDETDSRLIRESYESFAENNGNEALWQKLVSVDPLAAEKIHQNNRRKVIRALEVFEQTGKSIFAPEKVPKERYDAFIIGLNTDREVLYQRINQRVDEMMTKDLVEEARSLFEHPDTQAAKAIGYKELFGYLAGNESIETAVEAIKQNSRRYAKRQLTWFRNKMDVHWFDLVKHPEEIKEIETQVQKWLQEG